MTTSRAELEKQLETLHGRLPGLAKRYPDDEGFLQAFVQQADLIANQAQPEDHSWVHGQIVQMLADAGRLREGVTRTSALPPGS
jgi:hypothetical protein